MALQLQNLKCYFNGYTPTTERMPVEKNKVDHLTSTVDLWNSMPEGLMCPIDMSKAFYSITHCACKGFLSLMCVPQHMISAILHLFQAPMIVTLAGSLFPHAAIHPTSGVRQGCPMSPTLFSMFVSQVILHLQSISTKIVIKLYVDNLLIIIPLSAMAAISLYRKCSLALRTFTKKSPG